MKYSITRRAILIASPGRGSEYLPGVKMDIQALVRHLRSSRGGGWYAHEITVLEDPTAEKMLAVCQMTEANYLFIYFSGHGHTAYPSGYRMLNCQNGAVADIALVKGFSPRILLACDAYRNFQGEGIGSIPLTGPDYFNFTGEPSEIRNLFDEFIMSSPAGKTIIHGTQSGKFASDSSHGGLFTQAFLHVAGRMTIDHGIQMVRPDQVLFHVPGLLRERGHDQEPEVIHYSGDLRVPFAVALPAPREVRSRQVPNVIPARHQDDGLGQLLLGIGLFVLAGSILKQ